MMSFREIRPTMCNKKATTNVGALLDVRFKVNGVRL